MPCSVLDMGASPDVAGTVALRYVLLVALLVTLLYTTANLTLAKMR